MDCKIVVVADQVVDENVALVCSMFPDAEILVFCASEIVSRERVSCFDFTKLVGIDHERQIVSLRSLNSRDFYMVSYDMLFVFSDVSSLKTLKDQESA